MRVVFCVLLVGLAILQAGCSRAPAISSQEAMDRDLMEITIPQLEQLYSSHKYTVTEVVRWHMARIEKYNGIYRAVQNLDMPGALATAAREDADATAGAAVSCAAPCGAFRS